MKFANRQVVNEANVLHYNLPTYAGTSCTAAADQRCSTQ